jgi:hypothetical protein
MEIAPTTVATPNAGHPRPMAANYRCQPGPADPWRSRPTTHPQPRPMADIAGPRGPQWLASCSGRTRPRLDRDARSHTDERTAPRRRAHSSFAGNQLMRRDQLEHAIRAACQIVHQLEVIIVGSQAILGTDPEDELPRLATRSLESTSCPLPTTITRLSAWPTSSSALPVSFPHSSNYTVSASTASI